MLSSLMRRVDPRVLRTRQALHQAFAALFEELHDFDRVTVQDIADRAGVNRATFYAHFEDKYALLNDFISQSFQTRLANHLPAGHVGIVGVHTLVRVTCEFVDEMVGSCSPPAQGQHGALMIRQIQTCIKDIIRNDMALSDPTRLPDELAVTFTSWAVFGAAFDWAQTPRRRTPQTLADDVLALVQSGIASGRGSHGVGL